MTLLESLNWRYATKKMNGQKVPQEKLDYILEATRLAPSSSGLQPYEVFVISNKKILEQIKEISFNQSQITDCSHLLVFASWDAYSYDRIGNVFSRTTKERGLPENTMEDYHNNLWGAYKNRDAEWQNAHTAKQTYIALGLAIAAAAEQKVDATPMEGFDSLKLDELLELDKKGLKSAILLPLGYRAEGDWLVNLKKVRSPKEEFFTEIV